MSNLPSDIIAEVLCGVPALSLLRFRCVSKSWRAIIDSPEFIKFHLNRTIETNSDRKLIINTCFNGGFNGSAEFSVLDRNHDAEFSIFQELDDYTRIVGSCHGLLCLHRIVWNGIEIWNPTTRKVLTLSEDFSEDSSGDYVCYGFGYDKLSNDYKVLCILSPDRVNYEARVFSVKSNSWRKVGSFPSPLNDHPGKLVEGALHWIVRKPDSEREYLVAAFDLETEEYRLVELPHHSVNYSQPRLYLLGESLCFCNNVKVNPVEFWVMKTCGDIDSWTKLCTISFWISCRYYKVKPIAYSRDGRQVVIYVCDYLFWYDLRTKRIRCLSPLSLSDDPEFQMSRADMEFHICFGSLVQLGGAKSIPMRPQRGSVGR